MIPQQLTTRMLLKHESEVGHDKSRSEPGTQELFDKA